MGVIHRVNKYFYNKLILKIRCRVAEWSALRTVKRGDPSSNPVKVKFFFTGIECLNLIKF